MKRTRFSLKDYRALSEVVRGELEANMDRPEKTKELNELLKKLYRKIWELEKNIKG